MDFIRHTYTTWMRFEVGGPLVKVRWFWADPAAKRFPGPHRFGSIKTWYLDQGRPSNEQRTNDGLGEQWPLLGGAWDPGNNKSGLVGDHYCGPLEAFYEGGRPDDPPLALDADGVPTCCRRAALSRGIQGEGDCPEV